MSEDAGEIITSVQRLYQSFGRRFNEDQCDVWLSKMVGRFSAEVVKDAVEAVIDSEAAFPSYSKLESYLSKHRGYEYQRKRDSRQNEPEDEFKGCKYCSNGIIEVHYKNSSQLAFFCTCEAGRHAVGPLKSIRDSEFYEFIKQGKMVRLHEYPDGSGKRFGAYVTLKRLELHNARKRKSSFGNIGGALARELQGGEQ